jgi:hypothetical protein
MVEGAPASPAPTRVVIGGLPPLMIGLIRSLLDRIDRVDVVAEVPDIAGVANAAAAGDADVAVIGPDGEAAAPDLLGARPAMTLLCVTPSGESGTVIELTPTVRRLGELSEDVLTTAIVRRPQWRERFGA